MEIFETFGLDPIIIVAQIVNFLVILYILKRFLYKPLFKTFKTREALIKESIEKAEQARKELEKAKKEERDVMKKAQVTAQQIIAEAKEQSATILKDAQDAAKKQTQQTIEEAKEQITRETKLAEQQLNKHVGKLAVELLEKSLNNVFTEKEQSQIVAKAVKSLDKRTN
jgi:F-type H+-transporting ATPase subunit b